MGQGGGNAGTVGGGEPPGAATALPRTWSIRIENPALISFAGISKQVRKKDVIERKKPHLNEKEARGRRPRLYM